MNSTLHFLHIFRLDFHLMGDGDYLSHDAMGILIEYISASEVTRHDGSHNISSRLTPKGLNVRTADKPVLVCVA
jgi:hypothetical protein